MTECDLVVDVYPQSVMVSRWSKPKFEISADQNVNGGRSENTINRGGTIVIGGGGEVPMTCEENFLQSCLLDRLGKGLDIFIGINH